MESNRLPAEGQIYHTAIYAIFICIDIVTISVGALASTYLFFYEEYCASMVSTYLFSMVANSLSVLAILFSEILGFWANKFKVKFAHDLAGLHGITALLANLLVITWGSVVILGTCGMWGCTNDNEEHFCERVPFLSAFVTISLTMIKVPFILWYICCSNAVVMKSCYPIVT